MIESVAHDCIVEHEHEDPADCDDVEGAYIECGDEIWITFDDAPASQDDGCRGEQGNVPKVILLRNQTHHGAIHVSGEPEHEETAHRQSEY